VSLSLLLVQDDLVQNESISPDILSLLATKIPNANTNVTSFSQLREGEIDVGNYELVITQDKFVNKSLCWGIS